MLSPMNIKINHKILLNIQSSEYLSNSTENQNNNEFEKEEIFSYFEPIWKIEQISEILISQFQCTLFLDYHNIEKIINSSIYYFLYIAVIEKNSKLKLGN